MDLTYEIDQLIKTFPPEEKYALASQIKRAADSIALNIAEGSTGQSNKEFARFLGIALRSGVEVVACLHLGKRREIIPKTSFSMLYAEVEEIVRMIQGLRKSLQ